MAYLYTESDDNDLTYFLDYNLKCMERALQNVREYIQRKQNEQRDAFRLATNLPDLSSRQAEVLKYIIKSGRPVPIKEISTMFDVVYQTARTDLLDLVDKGHLVLTRDKKKMLFSENVDKQKNSALS
jgi:Fic family protein